MKQELCIFCVLGVLPMVALCFNINFWPRYTNKYDKTRLSGPFQTFRSNPALLNYGNPINIWSGMDKTYKKWTQGIQKATNNYFKYYSPFYWKSPYGSDPDANRDLTQLIVNEGYPVEKYTVQTKDGFLLDLHRIPHGRNNEYKLTGTAPKPAIFLQHGFISSANDWVMNFAKGSLGFILADNGYDVWMGNSRGSTLSRKHVSLKPYDEKFWDWSFDEMAKYDTPANIDFILNKTGQPSVYYVGHSQGTIMAFALFSQQPEYQKKVRLFVGLAPIIRLGYMKSPLRYLSSIGDFVSYAILGRKEFLPNDFITKFLVDTVCGGHVAPWVCDNILFLLSGPDISNLNTSRVEVYMNHSPAGASVKDLVHFSQMIRKKDFTMYDYGFASENMKHYGQPTPPAYNVSKINVPSVLFTATNDWVADPKDVAFLESTLPNIKAKYNIDGWNHLDFVWGIDAPKLCYSKILEWLPKF